jgi:hypothetical protein
MEGRMNNMTSIEFEFEPLPPFSVEDIHNNLVSELQNITGNQDFTKREFDENVVLHLERHLPTKDEIECIKIILEIATLVGPPLITLIKSILEYIKSKYGKVRVLRLYVNNRTIEIPIKDDNTLIALEILEKG